MSNLNVPQQQTSGKTIARSGSANSLRPSLTEHEDDLVPISRSRRNSESNASTSAAHTTTPTPSQAITPGQSAASPGAPHSAAAQAGLTPLPPGQMQFRAENEALVSPVDWKEADHLQATQPQSALTTLYVGKDKKAYHVPTSSLTEKSPYLKKLLAEDTGHAGKVQSAEQTSFDDLDEFSMALFIHWLSNDGKLGGPTDFHSLAHYLSLYVLARKFQIESLENQVMDLVRNYYREQNMTAPAYRLEYIYTYTHGPNMMRTFLISTAAFRALEEQQKADHAALPMLHHSATISGSLKEVLVKNPEMAMDFVDEVVALHRTGEHDARRGQHCA